MGDTVPDHKNIKLNVLLPGQKSRDKTYWNCRFIVHKNIPC